MIIISTSYAWSERRVPNEPDRIILLKRVLESKLQIFKCAYLIHYLSLESCFLQNVNFKYKYLNYPWSLRERH